MAEDDKIIEISGPLLALLSFCCYWLSFRFNALVGPWAEYAPGVSLLFLPAGVKLVALLVAGGWGVLGLGLAALMMAKGIWTDGNLFALIGNIVVWLGVPYLLIESLLRWKSVKRDLSNLTFPFLLLIVVVVTSLSSIANSAYAVAAHGRKSDDLLPSALAMAVGDFVGAGLMLLVLMCAITLLQRRRMAKR